MKVKAKKAVLMQYNLVIYPIDFVVAIGDVEEEVNNTYKPFGEGYNHIAPPQEHTDAATYRVTNKKSGEPCIMVWIPDKEYCTSSSIGHECIHAAMEIFSYIGTKPNPDDQEPFAYLGGNLIRLFIGCFYELPDVKPPVVSRDAFCNPDKPDGWFKGLIKKITRIKR